MTQTQYNTPVASTAALHVTNLHKRYDDKEVVCGIDFSVPRGTCFGLLGPNGAGKTTVFNLLTKFLQPTRGTITFTCDQGSLIAAAIDETIQTREGVTLWLQGTGVDEDGDVVTVMNFEWTLKVKNP